VSGRRNDAAYGAVLFPRTLQEEDDDDDDANALQRRPGQIR
jgi:hypothetical protein